MDDLSKSDLVAAFIEHRLSTNLEAFKENLPEVYELFKSYQEKRYYLLYDDGGNVNVFDRESEELLYGANLAQETLDNFEEYAKSPVSRPYLIIGSKECKVNPVHNGCMARLGEIQKKLILDFKVSFMRSNILSEYQEAELDYSGFGLPDQLNTLLFLSVGAGFDLEKMYAEHDIRRLIILEPDLDIFYCSLQLIDWVSIFDKSKNKGLSVYIALSEDIDGLAIDASRYIHKIGRHNAAGAFLYSGFYKEEYGDLFKGLKKEFDLTLFSGFGFYDDSRISVAHTYHNLKNSVPCIKSDKSITKEFGQRDWPIIIVGNGPSLDNEIEFLKENSDNAVIISSGSSLTTLYKHGIVPDFHAELERTAHVPVWLKAAADGEDYYRFLKKIRLIAMSQVHPEVFSLFDSKGQMPKDNESGSLLLVKLFGEKGARLIARSAPSCLHVAFTFSVLAGFKEIFLVGADMGFKSKERHHSKDSLYEKLSDDVKKDHDTEGKALVELEANFGEEHVYSYRLLPMFKKTLETIIKGWVNDFNHQGAELHVFNCSDGALIEGAEPKPSSELEFTSRTLEDKTSLADSIMGAYFAYHPTSEDAEQYRSVLEENSEKFIAMCGWLKEKLRHVDDEFQGADLIDDMAYGFHSKTSEMGLDDEDSWLYTFFDGTLLYALSVMQSTLFMPTSRELRLKAFNDSVDELDRLFDEMLEDFSKNLFQPDKEEYYDNYFG